MIRAALAIALVVACVGPASADEAKPKKDLARLGKTTAHPAISLLPGAKPVKLINLYNTWTHEWLAVDPKALPTGPTIDRFLRDHYTNVPTKMVPRLIAIVVSAAQKFRSDTAMVVSAFRHPKYNLLLRKKGHQVARDSHHSKGDAIDFFIPRVTTMQLHAWAKDQKIGGVGLYLDSGFVHMDTGPIRFWSGE